MSSSYSKPFLGKKVLVKIDNPLGSPHSEWNTTIYPVNYGYVEGVMAPDGEELDAYVLGVDCALEIFEGYCIAIIHRLDDDDDKLIVVPEGIEFSDKEIMDKVNFIEQYFKSEIMRK